MQIQPVILCGGSGTRLWPASREHYPKQLLALLGDDSLLQATAQRLQGLDGLHVGPALVVANEEYRFVIAEQLRQVGVPSRILLEPTGRNTAPALTLAALTALADGDDPLLLVMPSDHVVRDVSAFGRAVMEGVPPAGQGALVTFGVVPDRPETGYGYIRAGQRLNQTGRACRIDAFVEKPDAPQAAAYVASGEYFWNAGIFLLRASTWRRAVQRLAPAILAACEQAVAGARRDLDFLRVDRAAFEACPTDSIDYAVMEKLAAHPDLGAGVVVPMSVGWSDVGAWDALWAVADKDEHGNAVRGPALLEDTRNSLVMAHSRLVATVGMEDAVVVETPDAVLVANKAHTQSVKKIVERLRRNGDQQALQHRKVYRPWGWYDAIDAGERFQVKRIVVNPGARLSLQMHHHRAEHWIVVRGTAEVTCEDRTFLLTENQSTYIPLGQRHRLANPGKLPLEIIEVQSGAYLGEDDIVRFEDHYGRVD
ncbi:mannose-1-phosphate guanylyltransferase/mannose-6-phosphate isomerase [Caldimonas manganoxidans]|uniref:mannose-1-phosphate guanylyltransferase/mannose-6-phosphate isomerase n=1 Tax=Caldimonas manganoxidans TaxID=196015 RepID=UPI000363496F|nr:mannose-1-phosphate guanylyltransferase/mannose-6-phosphate isomerase [Caldimonas manganoxidans]